MQDLPTFVVEYLTGLSIEQQAPAFLRLDDSGRVSAVGGSLDRYGLADLAQGEVAEERLAVLAGMLPADAEPIRLASIEVAPGRHADVHIVAGDGGAWVLLLDRTQEVAERRIAQQLANDMSLLRGELARAPGATLKSKTGALGERPAFDPKGERRSVCVLTAVLCGLDAYGEREPAEAVFRDICHYVRTILRPVIDEAGDVAGVSGDHLTATFGVLPTTAPPPQLAVSAALRVRSAVRELNAARAAEGSRVVSVGIGVASGSVAFGVLGENSLRLTCAIGPVYECSERLAREAAPRGMLLDSATYTAIEDLRLHFSPAEEGDTPPRTYTLVQR